MLAQAQTEDESEKQRERIETARHANRALNAVATSSLFPPALRRAMDSQEEEPVKTSQPKRNEIAEQTEAEERLRRANGGLPDFPPPQAGETKDNQGKTSWRTIGGMYAIYRMSEN